MSIVHITAPARTPSDEFGLAVTPPLVGSAPTPQLFTKEEFAAPDASVNVGTWEATPGCCARAIVDAEFSQFVSGHATFVTDPGMEYQFRGGGAACVSQSSKRRADR